MQKTGSFDTDYFINLEYLKIFCQHCRAVISADPADHGRPIQCHSCGEYLIVPKNRFAPSVVINDFVLQDEIGSGGCGTVFLAYQISLDRYCALKILHDRIISEEKYLHELMQEGRIAGRLNHPNIVQCYSIGEEEGIYYYAMEYIDGKSVKDLLNEKYKLNPARSVDIAIQIVSALSYAWSKERLVHRDVKPDNIMINIDGEAKLTDMGLALPANSIQPSEEEFIKGSPQYISPEQILDQPQDFRSDIYSLGTVLFRMLTGQFVFKGSTAEEICQMHVDEKPVSPAKYSPELPPELCNIVLKMLKKNPENRYANYESLKKELLEVREFCDTHTASQEIITAAKPKTKPPLPPGNLEISKGATPLQWAVSATLLLIFASVSYWFIMKKQPSVKPVPTVIASSNFIPVKKEELKVVKDKPAIILKLVSKPVISALMPDPQGYDPGNEWIEITNTGNKTADLSEYIINDQDGRSFKLFDMLKPGSKKRFILPENSISLNNKGDKIRLLFADGKPVQEFSYTEAEVIPEKPIPVK